MVSGPMRAIARFTASPLRGRWRRGLKLRKIYVSISLSTISALTGSGMKTIANLWVGLFLLVFQNISHASELTKLSYKDNAAQGTCGKAVVQLTGVNQNASTGRVGGYNYDGVVTVSLTQGGKAVSPPLGIGRISVGCLDEKTILVIEDKAPATRNFKAYDAATLKTLSVEENCDGACLVKAGIDIPKNMVSFDPPID